MLASPPWFPLHKRNERRRVVVAEPLQVRIHAPKVVRVAQSVVEWDLRALGVRVPVSLDQDGAVL